MPCLLGCLAISFPRVVLALVWLFSNYLGRAYHGGLLWPILGFIFMPLTTLAYAWAINSNAGSVNGIYLVVVVLAVLFDMGLWGGASRRRKYRTPP